ncbi:MAG: hypothetical protein HYZ45_12465 [Burkholderiales bacterium]|nr:hypothetical protein [Burkholderiales bacterium]
MQANLRQLNQCQLRMGRRLAYSEKLARKWMPLALTQLRSFAAEGQVPDSLERKENIELISDCARRLLDSYRIVFKHLYSVSNFRFARGQKLFYLAAYRIVELTRFYQRVLGLRYQVLSEQAWLTVNIVFHVMHAHGKAEMVIHSFEDLYAEQHTNRALQDLYLIIQMNARLDILRWPTEWQFSLDSYGRIVHTMLKLEEDDGNMLRQDYAIAYCYDDCPARPHRIPGQTTRGQGFLLNFKNLKRKLVRDYERTLERQSMAIDDKAYSLLSFNDGLALLQLQRNCWLGHPLPLYARDAQGQKCDVRMFIGFNGIYPFLFNLHYGTGPTEEIGHRMVDLLAQRSALFAEDNRSTTESVWMMLAQDERRITLKTQETPFTTNMRIGALAAYGFGAEGMRSSAIGNISRIHRPGGDMVIVEIEKLGQNSEPVLITPDLACFEAFDDKNKEVSYGILAVNGAGDESDSEQCHLLLPSHAQALEGHQLVMKRVGMRQIILVGRLESATKTYRSHGYKMQMSMDA